MPSLAVGTVPDPRFVALRAVKLIPELAGMGAGGVSVEALMSSVLRTISELRTSRIRSAMTFAESLDSMGIAILPSATPSPIQPQHQTSVNARSCSIQQSLALARRCYDLTSRQP